MDYFLSRKMKYLMTTIEMCNFNKAAEKLCISRTPLIKTISEIESRFNTKFFHRNYNNLEPTKECLEIYEKLKSSRLILNSVSKELYYKGGDDTLQLIFDISVPYLITQEIIKTLKIYEVKFNHSRELITKEYSDAFFGTSHIFISLRKLPFIDGKMECEVVSESYLCLLRPKTSNSESMHPVLVSDCEHSDTITSWFSYFMKDKFTSLEFKKVKYGILEILTSIESENYCYFTTDKYENLFNTNAIDVIKFKDIKFKPKLYLAIKDKEIIMNISKAIKKFL